MTIVTLGNEAPIQTDGGTTLHGRPTGWTDLDPTVSHTTTIVFPNETAHHQIADQIEAIWSHHSSTRPGWVVVEEVSDNHDAELVERILRDRLGVPRPTGPVALLTNAGLDFFAKQAAGVASATAVAKWVALTANATAPGATDTTLTGEIATGGGGLVRAAATYAHTTGATTYTLTNTFTANGSDTLPVTVAKIGCFDASTSGNMVFETMLSSTATLTVSGDNLPLTWTITL